MFLVCERWVETRTDCYFDPSYSDHSSTSFSSWLGLLNRGSLRAQSPLSAAGSHFGILSPTDLNRLRTWLYYCLMSTCFRCSSAILPLIYTGASLDWWLGRGSIYNKITHVVKQCTTCQRTNVIKISTIKILPPQQVSTTAWTASLVWYNRHKLILSKILQNFWLTLVTLTLSLSGISSLACQESWKEKIGEWTFM